MITRFDDLLSTQRDALKAVIGKQVQDISVAWYQPLDCIHAASPIIIHFDETNLELWTIYVSEFSLSWNTIDLDKPPFYWLKHNVDSESIWKKEAPEVASLKGKTIRRIHLWKFNDWCSGMRITHETGSLFVHNSADELCIDESLPDGFDETSLVDIS